MVINASIRERATQFFIQEAPELLQVIEQELLSLVQQRSPQKVHSMMRAAHSLKGGAASVGLETVTTIAHRLEDFFRALHHESIVIDSELEDLLLQGFDCLRNPLMEVITKGRLNKTAALKTAEETFLLLDERLGCYGPVELPTSAELGVDMTASIFTVDVVQGLERLRSVVSEQNHPALTGELRAQAEVFLGLADLLELPGFADIARCTMSAIDRHPTQAYTIAQIAIADFELACQQVIEGDRTRGGEASDALQMLANGASPAEPLLVAPVEVEPVPVESVIKLAPSEPVEIESVPVEPAVEPVLVEPAVEPVLIEPVIEPVLIEPVIEPVPVEPVIEPILVAPVKVELVAPEADPLPSAALDLAATQRSKIEAGPPQVKGEPIAPQEDILNHEQTESGPTLNPSVRVDLQRLEQLNNQVGELAIAQNGQSLQNERLQNTVRQLLDRLEQFNKIGSQLRTLSDQTLAAERSVIPEAQSWNSQFDALELDRYSQLHLLLQTAGEQIAQIEESANDMALFAGLSSQSLERQRRMLKNLRDDLMWARMLPLSEILDRFPRDLRDLSRIHHKPVELQLKGTHVLVDKAVLEKLYDPLLHLVRNAFDHGIELPEARRQAGKPEKGTIEIRAYHQGGRTVIEVRDDGRGVNFDHVRNRAIERGWLTAEQAHSATKAQLIDLLFEPGFSTASKTTELSGRGVGLDVVRSQLTALKGSITITSEPGQGALFSLFIPLTLTVAKLLVCKAGRAAYAIPSDGIETILVPKLGQITESQGQRRLQWRRRLVPVRKLSEVMTYNRPIPEMDDRDALVALPFPDDWARPLLLLRLKSQCLAIEIDQIVTEQELVIKPLGTVIAQPGYIYGCTILGDGSVIPVIDGSVLLTQVLSPHSAEPAFAAAPTARQSLPAPRTIPTLLIVDDSQAMRQTLRMSLEGAGYRVVTARDGREAIDQLHKHPQIQLTVCDIEMPNMNGFEFLDRLRQDTKIAHVPVVMLTSRTGEKHRRMAQHLGASGFFNKPFAEPELLGAIVQLTGKQLLLSTST